MTKAELADALHALRWKQADLARKLGVHQNTVSTWITGSVAVPAYVAEYMRVLMLAKEMLE
jgi:plasmid maintenance system antidote protein VapI